MVKNKFVFIPHTLVWFSKQIAQYKNWLKYKWNEYEDTRMRNQMRTSRTKDTRLLATTCRLVQTGGWMIALNETGMNWKKDTWVHSKLIS